MRDPFVGVVIDSYRWWKERQLETQWSGAVPMAVLLGVGIYARALDRVLAHDMEQERKQREAERERAGDGAGSGRPRRPRRWPKR